jgi:hypothetical protein
MLWVVSGGEKKTFQCRFGSSLNDNLIERNLRREFYAGRKEKKNISKSTGQINGTFSF